MSADDSSLQDPSITGESLTNIPGAKASREALDIAESEPRSDRIDPTLRLAAGELVAERYLVLRFIGRGGMGEVYEVKDTLLNERLALKVISSRIASDERVRARFKREIQLARKVTHPFVCRIFDVSIFKSGAGIDSAAQQETLFLTMELLDGETLAQRLRRENRLSIAEAKPIIEQVTAGLTAAHKAGVIHRDLKTSNVILVRTVAGIRAVITDFGLARSYSTTQESVDSVSLADEIIGTPEYISPEHLQGKRLTPAADIYALGVMMYAMLTGRLPFEAADRVAAATKRLYEKAASPRTYVPDLDHRWAKVILRCLATKPEDRFASAADVADALGLTPAPPKRSAFSLAVLVLFLIAITGVVLLPPTREWISQRLRLYNLPIRKQLAILPFNATDGTAESGAFARGLAETLTSHLTQLTGDPQLQILPVDEVRGRHIETVQEARREFGVNLGIEGSVERYKSRRRVTYRLIDAKNLHAIYGETITTDEDDPFALEDRVATSVENALRVAISPSDRSYETNPRTQPAAYDFYLQGRGYLDEIATPQSLQSAIDVFSRALNIDPKYAPAYAGLGETYWAKYQQTHDADMVRRAKENCAKSVRFDDAGALGHSCLGTVFEGVGEYGDAVSEFRRAVNIQPTNDDAIRGLASALASSGHIDEAEKAYQSAIRLRPNYWRGYSMLGVFYFGRGRYEDAEKMFRQVIALSPDNYNGYSDLGAVYLMKNRYRDAIPLFDRASKFRPTPDAFSNLGSSYFYLHEYAEASLAFKKAVALDQGDYEMWGNWAEAEIRIRDKRESAFSHYQKAIALGEQKLQVTPKDSELLGNLALYYSMTGEKSKALAYLGKLIAQGKGDSLASFRAASVYNQCGQADFALKWLSTALKEGYPRTLVRDSPTFENLRTDVRFNALISGPG